MSLGAEDVVSDKVRCMTPIKGCTDERSPVIGEEGAITEEPGKASIG